MAGIVCFLLKIHPCRQRVRRLPLLFLGRDGGCAIALLRTVFYKHFPQSLQPLQINLLPQVSQFARKWGVYKSSGGMG